jgi:hypothetical protein
MDLIDAVSRKQFCCFRPGPACFSVVISWTHRRIIGRVPPLLDRVTNCTAPGWQRFAGNEISGVNHEQPEPAAAQETWRLVSDDRPVHTVPLSRKNVQGMCKENSVINVRAEIKRTDLTPCSGALLEKLVLFFGQYVSRLLWRRMVSFRLHNKPLVDCIHSQQQFSPQFHTVFLLRSSLIWSSHLRLGLPIFSVCISCVPHAVWPSQLLWN